MTVQMIRDDASLQREENASAVRTVRALRAELGTEHGTVHRVANQLAYEVESVRLGVRQADVDEGQVPGVSTSESSKMKALEQVVAATG